MILAEILAQMLEKRGIAVERQFELGGNLAHDALVSKQSRRLSRIHRNGLHGDLETAADHRYRTKFTTKQNANTPKNLI